MIKSYMSHNRTVKFLLSQNKQIDSAIGDVDLSWKHADIIQGYCNDLKEIINNMLFGQLEIPETVENAPIDRKKDKYTQWVEVMRLALFQYERFATGGLALSEGLYATLVALAATWGGNELRKIVVLGCGPGRTVLDFSRIYQSCEIEGLDYSLFSLMLAEKIICGTNSVPILRRNVLSDDYSEVLNIPGMNRKNVSFGLIDLGIDSIPKSDMIICSNVLNLLPNHSFAIDQMFQSLNNGGILILADLLGWRLDREAERKVIRTSQKLIASFEKAGFDTLEHFEGVPYIESESADQFVFYKEHFYVGRKR